MQDKGNNGAQDETCKATSNAYALGYHNGKLHTDMRSNNGWCMYWPVVQNDHEMEWQPSASNRAYLLHRVKTTNSLINELWGISNKSSR